MIKRLFFFVISVLSLYQIPSFSQMLPTVRAELHSEILKEERSLIIQLPASYDLNKSAKYPVLYLLDGTDNIGHTAGTLDFLSHSGEVPEMIIIGIVNSERFRDLSPSEDPKIRLKTGGGKLFLEFLETELIPYVNEQYRTENFKILAGHSLGGLFTLFSLHTKPGLFQAHFAFSPSMQWKDKEIVTNIKSFLSSSKNLKSFVYMNLGDEKMAMREGFDEVTTIFNKSETAGLVTKVDLFENETHGTTPVIGQFHAFRNLYPDWRVSFDILKKGYQPIVEHFENLSNRYGYQIVPKENLINGAGYYQLQEENNIENAIQLFELNIKNHPKSTNTYDSLAEAYEANGELVRALELVNKAIKLASKDDRRLNDFKEHKLTIQKKLDNVGE